MTHHIDQERGTGGGASTLLVLLLAVLMVGLAWLGVVSVLGTNHPLEATVGTSMLPTLGTGDLVVLRGVAPQEIRVGDIVAVHPSAEDRAEYRYPATVMHRVERISFDNGTVTVHTRGDNESARDPFSVPASAVEGRLAYSIPNAGWVLFYLRSRQGLIAVGGLLLLYLVYAVTKWVGDAAEELYEPETATATGFSELAFAMAEYGEHLRSHTRVVQELGGTTAELHSAAVTQNAVLDDLRQVLVAARSPSALGLGMAIAPPLTTAAGRSTVDRPAQPDRPDRSDPLAGAGLPAHLVPPVAARQETHTGLSDLAPLVPLLADRVVLQTAAPARTAPRASSLERATRVEPPDRPDRPDRSDPLADAGVPAYLVPPIATRPKTHTGLSDPAPLVPHHVVPRTAAPARTAPWASNPEQATLDAWRRIALPPPPPVHEPLAAPRGAGEQPAGTTPGYSNAVALEAIKVIVAALLVSGNRQR